MLNCEDLMKKLAVYHDQTGRALFTILPSVKSSTSSSTGTVIAGFTGIFLQLNVKLATANVSNILGLQGGILL